MTEINLEVPEGIDYLSQWEELWRILPSDQHYVLNKRICGCGATEAYLQSKVRKVILASPRKSLLYNKYSQHLKDNYHLYRFMSDKKKYYEGSDYNTNDLMSFKSRLSGYIHSGGRKILTTYDSLKDIYEVLKNSGEDISEWTVVVDEFQIIFFDSVFKASTEHEFLSYLSYYKNVVYLSATPLLAKYLNMTSLFRDYKIYNLEWPSSKVDIPQVTVIKSSKGITETCCKLIERYRLGNGDVFKYPDGTEFVSKEVVIYINNVKEIKSIVQKAGLSEDEVNIICASTSDNLKTLKKIKGRKHVIGDIPLKGEPHKMFTFCTSTVYVGADFYSTNASTYIFSNANIKSMTVDIQTDLQQILGRQRLPENPFSNSATLYYVLNSSRITQEEYDQLVSEKTTETIGQINNFNSAVAKETALKTIQTYLASSFGKADNYCSIYRKPNGEVEVIDNDILRVAEFRAFETTNLVYSGNFSLYQTIKKKAAVILQVDSDDAKVQEIYERWVKNTSFSNQMKYYCELVKECPEVLPSCQSFIYKKFGEYYDGLGEELMEALEWKEILFKKALYPMPFDTLPSDEIAKRVLVRFKEDQEYTKTYIKEVLQGIYDDLGITKTSKASDISQYLDCKSTKTREDGKGVHCFKVISTSRKEVSLFNKITEVSAPKDYRVDKILDIIQTSSYFDLSRKIEKIRNEKNVTRRNGLKLFLPAVCWNGTFSSKNKNSNLTYSSYVALDFDHVQDMGSFKEWLKGFPCVYAIYCTPSGAGYKAIVQHDNSRTVFHDDLLSNLFKLFDCPEIDKSVKDFARAHYLSYDPDLWRNDNPVPYHYVINQEKAILPVGPEFTVCYDEIEKKDVYVKDGLDIAGFLDDLRNFLRSDEAIINYFRRSWTGEAISRGRNNAAMSYLGVLCKAGVNKEKSRNFVSSLIPGFDISQIIEYSYTKNDFGCSRRKK